MSDGSGYIKLHRKMLDNWMMADAGMVQLWVFLLLSASHSTHCVMANKKKVELNPGELVLSRRACAEALRMTEKQVRGRLDKLAEHGKIAVRRAGNNPKDATIITILKWSEYQIDKKPKPKKQAEPIPDAPLFSGEPAEPEHNGDCYITKKKRKLTGKRLETFEKFWEAFDYKKGKADAADAWLDIPRLTDSLCQKIYAAARLEAQRRRMSDGIPKMAQGWLSSRRWEDYEAELQTTSPQVVQPRKREL